MISHPRHYFILENDKYLVGKFTVSKKYYKLVLFFIQSNPAVNLHLQWYFLSGNPNAIPILEQNQDKLNWNSFSGNPNAIPILEQNQDKINWYWLSRNPNAIHLLVRNLDRIHWKSYHVKTII